jgi:hypothetical protein
MPAFDPNVTTGDAVVGKRLLIRGKFRDVDAEGVVVRRVYPTGQAEATLVLLEDAHSQAHLGWHSVTSINKIGDL